MNDDPPTISSLNYTISSLNYLMAEDTEVLDSSTRNWRDVVNATNKMIIQETSLAEGEQTAQPTAHGRRIRIFRAICSEEPVSITYKMFSHGYKFLSEPESIMAYEI